MNVCHLSSGRAQALCLTLALSLSLPVPAAIPGIALVDRTTLPAAIGSNGPSVGVLDSSTDGRYALFLSAASSLVGGDTNGVTDLFLHDAIDGSLERVNVASDGSQANAEAIPLGPRTRRGGISDDGRYVTFASPATNFVAEPTHDTWQVYRRDRVTGTTSLISRGSDGLPATRYVALGASTPDGRYTLLATSAENFPDTNGRTQVYRHDATDGSLTRVSVSFDGQPADARPDNMEISTDGRFVLFSSFADNIVPGGTAGSMDMFLRDLHNGTPQQVSVTDSGAAAPAWFDIGDSNAIGLLSGDGRYAVFSIPVSLAAADTDALFDVYRFDRLSGTTTLISTETGGVTPLWINRMASISADGNRVLFLSAPQDPIASMQLFMRDMAAGTLTALAHPSMRSSLHDNLALSRDGQQVYFSTGDLPPDNGFSDVYRLDTATAAVTLLSAAPATSFGAYANGPAEILARPAVSADGNLVAFASTASNLVNGDSNGVSDVFVRDRAAATTQRISLGSGAAQSSCASASPAMTPDARYVVFMSCGALLAPASGTQNEIYRHDRHSGTVELVSIGAAGERADGASQRAQISADGRYVAFISCARNLAPVTGGYQCQIYLRDMTAGTTVLASRSNAGQPASNFAYDVFLSADGRFVGFTSLADNLVAADTNNNADAFLFGRVAGTTERISLGASGAQGTGPSSFRGLDQSGNLALFESSAGNFSTPSSVEQRVYLRDRGAQTTTLIAVPGDARASATDATISADGRYVAMISYSANSAASAYDDSGKDKLFIHDRSNGSYRALTWFTQTAPETSTRRPQFSADGSTIAFVSTRGDLTHDDGNGMLASIFVAQASEVIFSDGFD